MRWSDKCCGVGRLFKRHVRQRWTRRTCGVEEAWHEVLLSSPIIVGKPQSAYASTRHYHCISIYAASAHGTNHRAFHSSLEHPNKLYMLGQHSSLNRLLSGSSAFGNRGGLCSSPRLPAPDINRPDIRKARQSQVVGLANGYAITWHDGVTKVANTLI